MLRIPGYNGYEGNCLDNKKTFPNDGMVPKGASAEVLAGAGCALASVFAAGTLALTGHNYYNDDYCTYFIPLFKEISRLIGEGHFPIITDRIWTGGALLAEYQPAILNPVSIILYLLVSRIGNAATAALVFSLSYIFIFSAGTYFLCRGLGMKIRYAGLAAILAPTADWILYWGASDWIPALVSIAWMSWAAGTLIRVYNDRKWLVPAAFATALFLTCGWPFALLGAALISTAALVTLAGYAGMRSCFGIILAMLCGFLIATPALLPMVPYFLYSGRVYQPPIWETGLPALLSIGLPIYRTQWFDFTHESQVQAWPMIYVAWFIPIVLANAGWSEVWKRPVERAFVYSIVLLGVLTTTEGAGPFRWMFRLLPYYALLLLVFSALIMSRQESEAVRWRLVPTAFAVVVPVSLSVINLPSEWALYVFSGGLVLLLVILADQMGCLTHRSLPLYAVITSVLIVWATSIIYEHAKPHYPKSLADFSVPIRLDEYSSERPATRRLLIADIPRREPARWRELPVLNTSLLFSDVSIFGYTPFGLKEYDKVRCESDSTCSNIAQRLTQPVSPTGRSFLDLMRVEHITIEKKPVAEQLIAELGTSWSVSHELMGATSFTRIQPFQLPEPISWLSSGVEADVLSQSPQRISMTVNNAEATPGSIILARAWYPGWTASLNGQALEADGFEGIFVRIFLPPGSSGQLSIVYWPAWFWPAMLLSASGVILLLILSIGRPPFLNQIQPFGSAILPGTGRRGA